MLSVTMVAKDIKIVNQFSMIGIDTLTAEFQDVLGTNRKDKDNLMAYMEIIASVDSKALALVLALQSQFTLTNPAGESVGVALLLLYTIFHLYNFNNKDHEVHLCEKLTTAALVAVLVQFNWDFGNFVTYYENIMR